MAKLKSATGLRQAFLQVIGNRASGDGRKAIQTVPTELLSHSGLAFVVIQHLDPARPSALRGLRSKVTPFPALEVSNRIAVQPNHVYVVLPNKKISMSGGTVSIGPITTRDKRHPIDDFMESLASERGNASIGGVLSGTATSWASCMAQEALTDAAKHARAKNIWVRLSRHGSRRLSIHDNGIGIDPDAVRGIGRPGLVSMEERALMADATLAINGRPSHGTRVKLVVPIRGATRENSAHSAGR